MRRFYALCALSVLVGCGDDPTAPRADAADDVGDTSDASDVSDIGADSVSDTDVDVLDDPADADAGLNDVDAEDVGPTDFVSTPEPVIQAGAAWTYSVELSAPAELVLSIAPDGATLDGASVIWTPPELGLQLAEFSIDAVRAGETVATQSFTVEINHPPLFLDTPPANGFVGQEFSHQPSFADEDGDMVSVELEAGPEWLSVTDDGRVTGTPDAAGTAFFTLIARDGRGGEASQESELSVVEPIRDLRADSYWTTADEAGFSIFGCCFTGAGPGVYWGGEELRSEVVNAGRLDLSFAATPRPGDQPVVLLSDGVIAGELPYPLAVLPGPRSEAGRVMLSGVDGAAIRLLASDDSVLEETISETDEWTSAVHDGVVFVEVDGVVALPLLLNDAAEPELIAATPRLHSPSDVVTLEFSAAVEEPIVVNWGESEASCFSSEPRTCSVTVPATASDFLTVTSAGNPVPALTSAIAGSAASLGDGPWIDWANRRQLRAGVPTLVLVSTLGGAPSSSDASIELVELGETYALVEVVAEGAEASIEVRGDRWTFAVE